MSENNIDPLDSSPQLLGGTKNLLPNNTFSIRRRNWHQNTQNSHDEISLQLASQFEQLNVNPQSDPGSAQNILIPNHSNSVHELPIQMRDTFGQHFITQSDPNVGFQSPLKANHSLHDLPVQMRKPNFEGFGQHTLAQNDPNNQGFHNSLNQAHPRHPNSSIPMQGEMPLPISTAYGQNMLEPQRHVSQQHVINPSHSLHPENEILEQKLDLHESDIERNARNKKEKHELDHEHHETIDEEYYDLDAIADIRFLISARHAGGIIGKGGCYINSIRDQAEVEFQIHEIIPNSPLRTGHVRGRVKQVVKSLLLMGDKVSELTRTHHRRASKSSDYVFQFGDYSLTLLIEHKNCGVIIGKRGQRITKNRNKSGAHIKISTHVLQNSTEKTVDIQGSRAEVESALTTLVIQIANDPKPYPTQRRYHDTTSNALKRSYQPYANRQPNTRPANTQNPVLPTGLFQQNMDPVKLNNVHGYYPNNNQISTHYFPQQFTNNPLGNRDIYN